MSLRATEPARKGGPHDPKRAAAAKFTPLRIKTLGQVSDTDIAAACVGGYTDVEIQAIGAIAVRCSGDCHQ